MKIEEVSHGPLSRCVEVQMLQAEYIFDGPKKIYCGIKLRYDSALPDKWPHNIGGGTMGVDVIRAILSIVFNHKNQRVRLEWAVGNLIDQPGGGIVVVRLL